MSHFVLTGDFVGESKVPTALVSASPTYGVLGSIITLDGRLSTDPEGKELTYNFQFLAVPVGSKVALEDFKALNDSGSMLSFSPDKVGQYIIGLIVSNGVFESPVAQIAVDIRAMIVPHARGIVPDGKFIWSYIRDAWTQVESRELFEVLWSALIQIVGGELLKLYQVDFNKSIRDIQEQYQRRWLSYEPKLKLVEEDLSFILGNTACGRGASQGVTADTGLAVIYSRNELVVVQGTVRPNAVGKPLSITASRYDGNVGTYTISGYTAKKDGFKLSTDIPSNPSHVILPSDVIGQNLLVNFATRSTSWDIGGIARHNYATDLSEYASLIDTLFPLFNEQGSSTGAAAETRAGDVFVIRSGVNAGIYRILEKSGSNFVVDHAPAGASTDGPGGQTRTDVYRPVSFSIQPTVTAETSSIAVPAVTGDLQSLIEGRIVVVNDQAFTLARIDVDPWQRVPVTIFTVTGLMPFGPAGLEWRVPHTLVSKSQNFEELGVSAGDTLIVGVELEGGPTAEVRLQVVGVDGNRLGFVLSTDPLTVDRVQGMSGADIAALASALGIGNAALSNDGTLTASGSLGDVLRQMTSIFFRQTYWNKVLPYNTAFTVAGFSFKVHPKAIIRNRFVPVDAQVRSIPALQEYVRQPQLSKEGDSLFIVRGEQKTAVARTPVVLIENSHYLVDGDTALDDYLTFRAGTTVVEADCADFLDRGVRPGDSFVVDEPLSVAGSYPIIHVLSNKKVQLARPVPTYPLGEFVPARVRVLRSRAGHFVRFVPNLFTAKNPAPDRVWAEVSFFDNGDNIENNFGILVGLTRQDLINAASSVSYRQAVAGLMYAYTQGPIVDKVRLGASILLGLPFTEHRGIIRAIDEAYRLDSAGKPYLGRISIEDLDELNQPLGIVRIYTFPMEENSQLAGIDVNPATGVPYVVGDTIEALASIAKGVEVLDLKTDPFGAFTPAAMIQRYHSARVRVNDSIFQPSEIGLVSTFLRRITPSYISLVLTSSTELTDSVPIEDWVKLLLKSAAGTPLITDALGWSISGPPMFDARCYGSTVLARFDGEVYAIRRGGNNLATVGNGVTQTLTVATGGLVNPRVLDERFEAPLCVTGDFLYIPSGLNAGTYAITGLTDTTITIAERVTTVAAQPFFILRKARSLIFSGAAANSTAASATVTLGAGLHAYGVQIGDVLALDTGGTCTRHQIGRVKESVVGSGVWDQVEVVPTPASTKNGVAWEVHRPQFYLSPSEQTFHVTGDGTNVIAVTEHIFAALADVGDLLQLQTADLQTYVILDPVSRYITPALPAGAYTAKILRQGKGTTVLRLSPESQVKDATSLKVGTLGVGMTADATCVAASAVVLIPSLPSGLLPGDLFTALTGANAAVDVGYGAGVYPVAEVGPGRVNLTVALQNSETVRWAITRRI